MELRERIEQKAYELYCKRDRIPRFELSDWLLAEKLVQEEMAAEKMQQSQTEVPEATEQKIEQEKLQTVG